MRDALGGIVNIQMILIFIAIVSGYLAFSVNYTKAFRVKDYIINKLEEYETANHDRAIKEIDQYVQQVGYSAPRNVSNTSQSCVDAGGHQVGTVYEAARNKPYLICEIKATPTKPDINGRQRDRSYFRVTTFINLDIPVINKIMTGLSFFRIEGETRLIQTGL